MSPEQARELFSEALEGELDAEQQAAFDAVLAADAELRADYEAFRGVLELTRQPPRELERRDLLPGVQKRLRARSKGRFYGDRFAQRAGLGVLHPVLLAILMLLLLGLTWVALETLGSVQLMP
jgi:hypothetical protein